MRYMREQLAHEIETEMGPRRMSRQRSAPTKKPPKAPRNIPIVVPFLAVAPDATLFFAIPDETLPAPDTRWYPSTQQQATTPGPDALQPAAASSRPGSRRAIEVLGLASPFSASDSRTLVVEDVGELPKDLAWTWASLDASLVPWWDETFGEKDSIRDDVSATSRLRRLITQQQSISQLERALVDMVSAPPGAPRASTAPLGRSHSSCSLQQHRASRSVSVVGRRAASTSSSPRSTASPLRPHAARSSLQQEVIVELSNELPRGSGDLYKTNSLRFLQPSLSGRSAVEGMEES